MKYNLLEIFCIDFSHTYSYNLSKSAYEVPIVVNFKITTFWDVILQFATRLIDL